MRLTRLDLERYGPFAGTVLDFRPDAALHIVYGRNEAGKSSALAAITDLFYGFELRSPANFRHRYEDLRIGADMIRPDGSRLNFWRRKRNKHSLTGIDGAPFDDILLEPMLAGISREVFLAAFGLDQGGLREGARQMLAAQGEVGESLFVAASGLKTLLSVRAGLDHDADALFGTRKSAKRAFYEAQERYDAARKALREQSLRADDVRDLEEKIAAQEAAVVTMAERLKEAGERRSRIDRVRRVGPLLARIARCQQGLQALVVPDLPAAFVGRIERALTVAQEGREMLTRLAGEVTQAREALDAIIVDDALLAEADAVTELNDERAVSVEMLRDLPRRQEEAGNLAAALEDATRRLGFPSRAALVQALPNDVVLERVRDLIDRRHAAEAVVAESDRVVRRARDVTQALDRQLLPLAAGPDPEPLRRRLLMMRSALADADTVQDREADFARRCAQFEERLGQLSPPVLDKQALWSWAKPAEETLADFERRLAEFDSIRRQDTAELARLESVIAEHTRSIVAEGSEGGLVDAATLAHQREARDTLFDALLSEPTPLAVNAFRIAVSRADELADKRLDQIERLARRDMAMQARDEALRLLGKVRSDAALRAEDEKKTQAQWQALFALLGCKAERPPAMRRFLADVTSLRQERAELAQIGVILERSVQRLAQERPALEAIALEAGLSGVKTFSLTTLIHLIEDRLDVLEQGARRFQSLKDQLKRGRDELARAQEEAEQARGVLEAAKAEWSDAVGLIGLGVEASTREATKACDLWSTVQGKLPELETAEHRIARMQEKLDSFAVRAGELGRRLLADQPGEPIKLASALMENLVAARQAGTQQRAARQTLARHRAALDQAQENQREFEAAVAALANEAGCDPAGLAPLAADLANRFTLQDELQEARDDLVLQGDGFDEAALRTQAAGISADSAAGEIGVVQAELATLAEEDKHTALALGDLRRQRAAIEREAGAASAAQHLQDARSDLERIAGDYIVLKIASLLIETGLERQLRTEQGPLIAGAGRLFSTITGNAFSGIVTQYDEEDRLRLAARRTDGGTVAIDGLSEGTRDQLYLSLRLANLEAMAARRQVPPFIGDDLVVTFDEPRVAATLSVLAAQDSFLQKILFTHHRHVADIARDRLGAAVDIIALGD